MGDRKSIIKRLDDDAELNKHINRVEMEKGHEMTEREIGDEIARYDKYLAEYLAIFEDEQQREASADERAELRARLEAGRPPLDSLRLLTVAEYAEREGITTQATYKRIKQGKLRGVTISTGEKRGRCVIVSAAACPPEKEADRIPTEAENRQQGNTQRGEAAPIGADARAELEKLRAENEKLRAQLDEERAAARAQSDRILSLAERLADLTAASQVLMQQQQQAGQLAAHVVEYEDTEPKEAPPAPAQTAKTPPEGAGSTEGAEANPQHVADLDTAAPTEDASASPAPAGATPPEQPKKGFFARLFGV